uniref:ACP phosphodiesterase n=1 Tax=Mangrovivirga cuniculi TaxID=2715131 RepID=UPI001586103B|nr:hypothetical protein [Mangrovivirga cuniculi]
MNFLAHLYLSGDHQGIAVGNFIGDFVKGAEIFNYPELFNKESGYTGLLMSLPIRMKLC